MKNSNDIDGTIMNIFEAYKFKKESLGMDTHKTLEFSSSIHITRLEGSDGLVKHFVDHEGTHVYLSRKYNNQNRFTKEIYKPGEWENLLCQYLKDAKNKKEQ